MQRELVFGAGLDGAAEGFGVTEGVDGKFPAARAETNLIETAVALGETPDLLTDADTAGLVVTMAVKDDSGLTTRGGMMAARVLGH